MPTFWSNNGQINLEYQRKRAKALLQRLKAGTEPQKLDILHKLNPSSQITLASAQQLIALELGFDSWPNLKNTWTPSNLLPGTRILSPMMKPILSIGAAAMILSIRFGLLDLKALFGWWQIHYAWGPSLR